MLHRNSTLNHKPENWTYADAAARGAATGFVPGDIGKLAFQSDTNAYWRLEDDAPITWSGPYGIVPAPPASGQLVPAGGTTAQVLAKNSDTDGDTEWITPASGGISWVTPPTGPTSSGTAGDMAYDGRYVYLCTATNNWARRTLETFLAVPVYTVDPAYPYDGTSFVNIATTGGTTLTDAAAGIVVDDGIGAPYSLPRVADNANGPVYSNGTIFFAKNAAGVWKATDNADPDIAGTTFYTGIGLTRAYPWRAGWSTDAIIVTKQANTAATAVGTQLLDCSGDDNQQLVELPWMFRFMGQDWDCLRVGTNGAVQLGRLNKFQGGGYGFQFPHAVALGANGDMGPIIAPYATDMQIAGSSDSSAHGTVWFHHFKDNDPDNPGDVLIQWNDVQGYGAPTEHLTFQLRLLRSVSGGFKFIYQTMTYAAGGAASWHFSDVGFQGDGGAAGNNIAHNTLFATSGKVVYISP